MPGQVGVRMIDFSVMVCGSRRSSCFRASSTMMAALPSGMKYML
ncbi:hypothetical protein [Mesorhizobium sp. WSM4904]|nr:hypothetical protein [Mesorhizobium sp. WSM4904]WFP66237.1 hypothetical protein QAZ47_09570 [Mesorhizobium sp. WSM4904]